MSLRHHLIVLTLLLLTVGRGTAADATALQTITTSTYRDSLVVRFQANGTIARFQRPELSDRTVIVRFLDVTHDAAIPAALPPGVSLRHERIRNVLVERIVMPSVPKAVRWRREGQQTVVVTIVAPIPAAPASSAPEAAPNRRWDLDVIVIDAGHGGIDVGAEGVNGAYEKTITLALARQLRERLATVLPSTKVVMTRDDDTFVELYRRGQIANAAGGKLFISIHCNSMPTKPHPAQGCETYILRPGRNTDAARVAARENSSVRFEEGHDRYQGYDEDQLIVATMAQRSFVRLSEELAKNLQREMGRKTRLKSRGVSQAGFFVLVGASMPNILFETAFLSNPQDAAYITSADGQRAVVDAMAAAIQRYARTYSSLLDK